MFKVIDKETGGVETVYQIGETPNGKPLFFIYDDYIKMWIWTQADDYRPMEEKKCVNTEHTKQ